MHKKQNYAVLDIRSTILFCLLKYRCVTAQHSTDDFSGHRGHSPNAKLKIYKRDLWKMLIQCYRPLCPTNQCNHSNTGRFRRLGRHIFHGTLFEAVFCPVNNIF